jgi:hypothetical protein
VPQLVFAAQIAFGCLNRGIAQKELDLLKFSTCQMTQPSVGATQVMRGEVRDAGVYGSGFHHVPDRFERDSIPHVFPNLFTRRKIGPMLIPAASINSSTARFTQVGTGTVRICFPLPIRIPENSLPRASSALRYLTVPDRGAEVLPLAWAVSLSSANGPYWRPPAPQVQYGQLLAPEVTRMPFGNTRRTRTGLRTSAPAHKIGPWISSLAFFN